jgi:hypothetical protein
MNFAERAFLWRNSASFGLHPPKHPTGLPFNQKLNPLAEKNHVSAALRL